MRAANVAISLSTNPAGTTVVPQGCCAVLVQADPLNVGYVAVGGPGITTVPAVGPQLLPGQSRAIAIDDISKVFVVGATVGLAVDWEYLG